MLSIHYTADPGGFKPRDSSRPRAGSSLYIFVDKQAHADLFEFRLAAAKRRG